MEERMLSSLWARTFARALASVFKSEMGLYHVQSVGSLPFFGISVMQASVKNWGNQLHLQDSTKTEQSIGESELENVLKNSVGKPSGPGHLLAALTW